MSIDKYAAHLLIVPEDDADRELAVGFMLHPQVDARKIQIMPVARGWLKALEKVSESADALRAYPERRMLVLIDFETFVERRGNKARALIPAELQDRVFVLGVASEPEQLKAACGSKSLERIGQELARECADGSAELWSNDLLVHNKPELDRLEKDVKSFLFKNG